MKNFKILILEGGFNEEHDVSLATGRQVKKALSQLQIKYDSLVVNPKNFERDIIHYSSDFICFNALHGTFGEDGNIQEILDKVFIKYTHSSAKTSYIGFNKQLTKEKIKDMSILTPHYLTLDYKDIDENILYDLFLKLGSFIIKPNSSGSSFGVKVFKDHNDIIVFLKDLKNKIDIYKNHNKLLIEKFIEGRELTVAVIEKNNKSFPVEVTEIITNNIFFDYKSKYTPGFSKHIIPAKIPKEIYNICKSYAKAIHDKISCKGISRSDFIYDNDNIYFLEINTHPGLTPTSLVPEQLKYQKVSFDEMILDIIKSCL